MMKANPAYYEETTASSDQESMAVSMAFSSEDTARHSQVSSSMFYKTTSLKAFTGEFVKVLYNSFFKGNHRLVHLSSL